eukprot:scaffold31069_cov28-Phaeocystis_antarctica.AAC.1
MSVSLRAAICAGTPKLVDRAEDGWALVSVQLLAHWNGHGPPFGQGRQGAGAGHLVGQYAGWAAVRRHGAARRGLVKESGLSDAGTESRRPRI